MAPPPMRATGPLSRRTLLALGAAAIVGACARSNDSGPTSTSPSTSTPPVPDTGAPDTTVAIEDTTTVYNPLPTPDLEGAVVYDGADNPFALGVAAGDATPRRIVLWTRLFPPAPTDTAEPESRSFIVLWEMALDPEFTEVAFSGATRADAEYAYAVHVDIVDLEPSVRFWYRFTAGSHTSPVGATGTMPYYTLPDQYRVATVVRTATAEPWPGGLADITTAQPDAVLCVDRPPAPGALDQQREHWVRVLGAESVPESRAACTWLHWMHADGADITDSQYQAWWEHSPVRLPPPRRGDQPPAAEYWGFGNLLDLLAVDSSRADDAVHTRIDGILDTSETRFVAVATPTSLATVRTKDSPLRAAVINHPNQRFVILSTDTGEVGVRTVDTAIGPIGDEVTLPAVDAGETSAWMLHTITPEDWRITMRSRSETEQSAPTDTGEWTLRATPPGGPGTRR